MKIQVLLYLSYLMLSGLLVAGCKKEGSNDKIDRFIQDLSGAYTARDCQTGGPVQFDIELDDARLRFRKTGAESAEIRCTHILLGEIFKCRALYETDSTLTIPGFISDGRELKGIYLISQAGSSVLLYDSLAVCRNSGQTIPNISFRTNK